MVWHGQLWDNFGTIIQDLPFVVHLSKWVHSPTFDGRRRRSWQVGKSDSSSCDRVKIATNHLLTKVDHQIPKLLATKYRISYFNDYISVVCFGLGHEQHTCCDIMFKHDLSLLIFYIYIYTLCIGNLAHNQLVERFEHRAADSFGTLLNFC